MSDSNEYDLGYYEGWRNAIVMAVGHFLAGFDINAVFDAMRVERDKAYSEYQDSNEEDEY